MKRKGKKGLDDIYVVGCGPSLKKFDWSLLKDKTTIAVNGSIRDVPKPDYFITADSYYARKAVQEAFYYKNAFKILVMNDNHKHFKHLTGIICEYNYRIKPAKFNGDIGFTENQFCTGQNSGFCGMQLAVILGAKIVHLLGIDCSGSGKGNYHGLYSSNPAVWDEFFGHFVTAVQILQKHNVKVISHSAISRLNNFIEYEELI